MLGAEQTAHGQKDETKTPAPSYTYPAEVHFGPILPAELEMKGLQI